MFTPRLPSVCIVVVVVVGFVDVAASSKIIPMPSPLDCGRSNVYNSSRQLHGHDRSMRIVGGVIAAEHAFPWTVGLNRDGAHVCGGVLVHPLLVLTAAHCVFKDVLQPSRLTARIGGHSIDDGEWIRVKFVIVHELFNRFHARAYDFALLLLSKPVEKTESTDFICLPTFVANHQRPCVVAGWGKLKHGTHNSPVLQQVMVPVVSEGVCNDWRHYRGILHIPTMMCAGTETGGFDACQGDSGGPLMCELNGQWQVHGLVSWGRGCALPNVPGVYAKVISINGWIRLQATRFGIRKVDKPKRLL